MEIASFLNCPLIFRAKNCTLLDIHLVDHLPHGSILPGMAATADADNLRLRANMTIPGGLRSENISMGIAIRRDSSLATHAVPEMGDADQRESMRSSKWISESHFSLACRAGLSGKRVGQSGKNPAGAKIHRAILLVLVSAAVAAVPLLAPSQALVPSEGPSATVGITPQAKLDVGYDRPTERTKVRDYAFDASGPDPIVGAGVAAGVNQWSNAPPEWGQGAQGFGKRFGSDFGIAAIGTTTRYGLAEAFREDTLYYHRCQCGGPLPRLRHAVVSTLTGRRGKDGHRVFSFSALAAPYAGSMIAVYTWYPDRFGAKDAFRMGNYSLLAYMGSNIALESLYSGPQALISRMHLNNAHGSSYPGPNH